MSNQEYLIPEELMKIVDKALSIKGGPTILKYIIENPDSSLTDCRIVFPNMGSATISNILLDLRELRILGDKKWLNREITEEYRKAASKVGVTIQAKYLAYDAFSLSPQFEHYKSSLLHLIQKK